jgi:hypothetical protein
LLLVLALGPARGHRPPGARSHRTSAEE